MANQKDQRVTIKPPNFQYARFAIEGDAPYMQLRFGEKAINTMIQTQEAGTQPVKGRKVRPPRDFEKDYEQAFHISDRGWVGIPAAAFRAAMISACRLSGYAMTKAKLTVFIEADAFDKVDGMPLVGPIVGDPEPLVLPVRNKDGSTDLRCRPMWRQWKISVRIRWDADQFCLADVASLLMRVGGQVGLGEGRPDSKNSAGIGFGTFRLLESDETEKVA